MSRSFAQIAFTHAVRAGTPFVFASGRHVALIMRASKDPLTWKLGGNWEWREVESAGFAKAVADRVLLDLKRYPQHGALAIDVSIQMVESARNRRVSRDRRTLRGPR